MRQARPADAAREKTRAAEDAGRMDVGALQTGSNEIVTNAAHTAHEPHGTSGAHKGVPVRATMTTPP